MSVTDSQEYPVW